jgi:branched-chain amino acid transport system permease protein
MKMINWAIGEFFMIGSYVQYVLIVTVFGARWWLALPVAMGSVFLLGLVIQRLLLRPMYVGVIERRDEYATIVTIALMILFRNLAIVLGGPASTHRRTTRGRSPSAPCRCPAIGSWR